MIFVHREKYEANDGKEYTVSYKYSATAGSWSIYIVDRYNVKKAIGVQPNRPSIAILNNVIYMGGDDNTIKYAYYNSDGDFFSGSTTNSPKAQFLISAKSRLFTGGKTTTTYATGTALFTNGSATVTGTSTVWTTNMQAGDLIGTGASPSVWYTVKSVASDTSLTLTANYAESTTTSDPYLAKRITKNIIYHSAEGMFTDWLTPGNYGGDSAGYIQLYKANTGIHDFDDAVLLFTKDEGFFIEGTTVATWNVPKRTRFPVGCISHESIASKNGYLGFMSEKGYYVTKGGSLNFSSLEAEPFSNIIQRDFDNIDLDLAQYIYAFPYKDLLFVSVPHTDSYSTTEALKIYDTGTVEITPSSTYSTGTATFTQNSVTVTGSGTTWVGNIIAGDLIGVGASPTVWYTVAEVASNTSLTISVPYAEATASGSAYKSKRNKTVTGTTTEWLENVSVGDAILIDGESTYYKIASIDSDTQLTLEISKPVDVTAGTSYLVQKRRNNKIFVLDTRVNIRKKSYGWTVFDNVNASSFVLFGNQLYYGSSVDNYIYKYDTGGALYGSSFTSSAKTKRENFGYPGEKRFAAMMLRARGAGTVYVTPIVDGVSGTQVSYTFSDTLNEEEIYFPRKNNPFNYIGNEIQYLIECTGQDESIYIYPPETGWKRMERK